jgi:hypothetical protein
LMPQTYQRAHKALHAAKRTKTSVFEFIFDGGFNVKYNSWGNYRH